MAFNVASAQSRAPLCFVEVDPPGGSPAYVAGLKAGDAILTFGSAMAFSDLPSQIQAYVPVRLVIMDPAGHIESRMLVPHIFDSSRPHSLLGCHITDVCPASFLPHPALAVSSETLPAKSAETESDLPPVAVQHTSLACFCGPSDEAQVTVPLQPLSTPHGLRITPALPEPTPLDTTSILNGPKVQDDLAAMHASWRQQPNTLESDWQEDSRPHPNTLESDWQEELRCGGYPYVDSSYPKDAYYPEQQDDRLSLAGTAVQDEMVFSGGCYVDESASLSYKNDVSSKRKSHTNRGSRDKRRARPRENAEMVPWPENHELAGEMSDDQDIPGSPKRKAASSSNLGCRYLRDDL